MEQIHYRAGYKYLLSKPHAHELMFLRDIPDCEGQYAAIRRGILYINNHYAWDGCSGPTLDTDTNMRAGLVHDALYQMVRAGKIPQYRRDDCDKEFKEICRQDGMIGIRRALYYKGLHDFGGAAIDSDAEPPHLTAPTNKRTRWKT